MNKAKKITLIISMASILGLAIAFSCSSRKNRIERADTIPREDLTEILTDIYLTDGLLSLPEMYQRYNGKDTLGAYTDVIKNHGYTKEQMDRTIRFYFIRRPKQMIKIYDKVLANLSELESRNQSAAEILDAKSSNLWRGFENYMVPPLEHDSLTFGFNIIMAGTYDFSFSATVFPDDATADPRMILYTCDPDSISTGKKHFIKTFPFMKDGIMHLYSYRLNLRDRSYMHFGGSFLKSETLSSEVIQHFIIEKITINYVHGPS